MKKNWDLSIAQLFEKGDTEDESAFAGIVIGASGQVLIKYGDTVKFINYKSREASEVSAELLAVIAKA